MRVEKSKFQSVTKQAISTSTSVQPEILRQWPADCFQLSLKRKATRRLVLRLLSCGLTNSGFLLSTITAEEFSLDFFYLKGSDI